VKTLKSASGCSINIAGGTEVGHASGTYSHYNGYKVDITHRTCCVDGYTNANWQVTPAEGCEDVARQWKAGSGNIYADEGSHWDITYYSCGC